MKTERVVYHTKVVYKTKSIFKAMLVDYDGFIMANLKCDYEKKELKLYQLKLMHFIKRVKQVKLDNESYDKLKTKLSKELKAWEKWATRMDGMLDFHYDQYEKDKKQMHNILNPKKQ
jgi:hypothetical protein